MPRAAQVPGAGVKTCAVVPWVCQCVFLLNLKKAVTKTPLRVPFQDRSEKHPVGNRTEQDWLMSCL